MGGTGGAASAADDRPGPAPLRRLTLLEYRNSVRDLIGDAAFAVPAPPPPRDFIASSGFATGPWITSGLEAQYYLTAADLIAAAAVKRLPELLPSTCPQPLPAADEEACAGQFILQFGLRVFRRPLQSAEAEQLRVVYRAARGPAIGHDFTEAMRVLIAAMFQSPFFLYRWEAVPPSVADGALVRLSGYEVASRLSYGFWATTPDARLLAAAQRGELGMPDRIAEEARRLLADPRAKDAAADFALHWLDVGLLPELPKDSRFTAYSATVAQAMLDETAAFFANLLVGPQASGSIEALYTSTTSFLDPPLAALYGVPNITGPGLRTVSLDPAQRAGILTQGSFLAAHADGDNPNPIDRAVIVLRRVLCADVEPEPPDIDIPVLPPVPVDSTNRERFEAHGRHPCAERCHKIIDPVGFAFEIYDAVGAYRTMDNGKPVDARGSVTASGSRIDFQDAIDLVKRIAPLEDVRRCMGTQWLRYLLRRPEGPGDAASLRAAGEPFRRSSDIRDLLVALTRTRAFTHRTPTPGEGTP
jgi:hypothetical protein